MRTALGLTNIATSQLASAARARCKAGEPLMGAISIRGKACATMPRSANARTQRSASGWGRVTSTGG